MQFPAGTVIVLLRPDVGYRLLNPIKLVAVNGALAVIAILAQPGNEDANPLALLAFAAVSFCAGMGQRVRRWRQLSQPARQTSYYIGTSPFNFRWLPAFMRRNRRISRFVDPLVCILVSVAVFPLSSALACYLAFAGFCLRVYESDVFERERERDLDLSDGLLRAEIQSQLVEQYEGTSDLRPRQPKPGLPTGVGSDLKTNLKRQQARRSSRRP